MDRKLKKAVNLKGYNLLATGAATANTTTKQSDSFMQTSYVIPTNTTSMPPVNLPPPATTLAKDAAGFNQYHSPQYRSTRQRTNITTTQQNANYNINTAATTTPLQLTQQQQLQSTTGQKINNNNTNNNNSTNNQTVMSAKAAACIASPMEQLAAVHAKATSSRNKNEEAINDLKTRIPEIENIFDIHSRIGNGTFSTVLLGTLKRQRDVPDNQKRKFAIKHHIPTSHPDRIMKELQCMAKIGGTDNVVGINCCIRCDESVAFIMPYLAHDRFHDFYNKMDVAEVQFYMKNLLIALRHVHRFNVIHRDVKPSNFLYNRRKRQFLLVDFGLAQQVTASQVSLSNNNSNLTGKLESLALLAPPTNATAAVGVGEGKRIREHDDMNSKKSLEVAVAVTGAGEVVSGTAKRLRCTLPPQEQQTPAAVSSGPTTRAANAANTGSKGAVASGGSNASVHERKSAVGAAVHTMSSRLQQKLRAQGGAETVHHSSTRTSSAGGGKNTPPITQAAIASNNNNNNNNNNSMDAKYNTNRNLSTSNSPKCYCYGNAQVCNICLVKKEIHASRAGTPGYRPPEVLLKYPDQTTAVDVWAAGVIFLSVLSSVYPFFKAPNDYVALAEMITIFGDKTIRKTAHVLDRLVTLSQKTKPLDLRKLCVRFRNRVKFSSPELLKKYRRPDGTCEVCKNCDQFFFNCLCMESPFVTESQDDDDIFPSSAYDLLYRLLEVNPHNRITADEALQHPFFLECHNNNNNITTSNPVTPSASALATTVPLNTPSISLAAAGDSAKKTRN
ncbi:cell division cycle 7-related protein kinase isoform X2 [Calliphora vicina]|uniref:cell division cycle 7-related protein kinase isoform X2 n=1 Tax=Calliphora vicina TaxID=7373 RepID=UPI00325BC9D1